MQKRYEPLRVGYIAMHGTARALSAGREELTLEAAKQMRGRASARWLHIGGCSVLRVPDAEVQELLRASGLAGLSGYRKTVYWFDSLILDLLVLGQLLSYQKWSPAIGRVTRLAPGLCEELGFVAHRRQ